jgi:hypothetical protein
VESFKKNHSSGAQCQELAKHIYDMYLGNEATLNYIYRYYLMATAILYFDLLCQITAPEAELKLNISSKQQKAVDALIKEEVWGVYRFLETL